MAKDPKPSLVDLVARATEDDLKAIDDQIQAAEGELDEWTKLIGSRLDSLKALRKVVDVKLHGKPERKKRQPRDAAKQNGHAGNGDRLTGLGSEIVDCIRLNGPALPATLGRKLDRPEHGITISVKKHPHALKMLPDGRVALADHDERD